MKYVVLRFTLKDCGSRESRPGVTALVRRPRLHHTESASWERGRSRSWPGHRLPGGSAAVRPVSHGTYRLWESAIVQVHAASCWHLSLAWGRPLRPVCRGCPAPQPGAAAVLATRLAFSDTPCDGCRTACGPSHLPRLTRQNVFRGSPCCTICLQEVTPFYAKWYPLRG